MSTSALIKQISITSAGAVLLALGTVGATPASAITFDFKGEFFFNVPGGEDEPTLAEGSYTIPDEVIEDLLEQPLDPNDPSSFDPAARRVNDVVSSFFLVKGFSEQAAPPTNSSITTYLANEDDEFPVGTPVLQVNVLDNVFPTEEEPIFSVFAFSLQVTGEPDLSQCLVGECSGFAQYAYPEIPGYQGTFSQVPADAKSVPEPAGALGMLAFGVLGTTSIVKRKKR